MRDRSATGEIRDWRLGRETQAPRFRAELRRNERKVGLGQTRQSQENEELIRKAKLTGYVVRGMNYPSTLPPELDHAYCYTTDGGHSVIVVLENEYHDGDLVEDYLVSSYPHTAQ